MVQVHVLSTFRNCGIRGPLDEELRNGEYEVLANHHSYVL